MIKRGEIYYADLSPVIGSEQGGLRPVLILQNIVGNRHSSRLPTHIALKAEYCGLPQDSLVLLEQVRTLDKTRLKGKTGEIRLQDMYKVNRALSVSLGLQSEVIRI